MKTQPKVKGETEEKAEKSEKSEKSVWPSTGVLR